MNGDYLKPNLNKNDNEISDLPHLENILCNSGDSSNINLRFLYSNKIFINNVNKVSNNMIISNLSNKNQNDFKKENKSPKGNPEIKNINSNNKIINFNKDKKSLYILLLYHIFHCLLFGKEKMKYNIDYMNKKALQKKLDIYNYLNLLKRVDILLGNKAKNKNLLKEFIS